MHSRKCLDYYSGVLGSHKTELFITIQRPENLLFRAFSNRKKQYGVYDCMSTVAVSCCLCLLEWLIQCTLSRKELGFLPGKWGSSYKTCLGRVELKLWNHFLCIFWWVKTKHLGLSSMLILYFHYLQQN